MINYKLTSTCSLSWHSQKPVQPEVIGNLPQGSWRNVLFWLPSIFKRAKPLPFHQVLSILETKPKVLS